MIDPLFWDKQYRDNKTYWDIGAISPPLEAYFQQLTNDNQSILIPGCGNAYEADWLLQNGFTNLTLIDISPMLTARLQEKFAAWPSPTFRIVTGDFFLLEEQFDLIIEQTFLSALPPELRPSYAEKMYQLLKPGGKLAGLLFDRDFPSSPPFGGHAPEYQQLLSQKLNLKTLAPCYNSIPPRAGTELFFIAQKPTNDSPT